MSGYELDRRKQMYPDALAGAPHSLHITAQADGSFWISDHLGFLCVAATHDEVLPLLCAEAEGRRTYSMSRPFYSPGARDLLYPGDALSREAKALAKWERHKSAVRKTLEEVDRNYANKSPSDILNSLGLTKGD